MRERVAGTEIAEKFGDEHVSAEVAAPEGDEEGVSNGVGE